MGNCVAKDKSRVCDQLLVPLILRAHFIDENVATKRHKGRTVALVDGSSAHSFRQKTVRLTIWQPAGPLFRISITQMGQKSITNRVVIAELIRVQPNSQTISKVQIGKSVRVVIQPNRSILVFQTVSACNGYIYSRHPSLLNC